jgi:hypothetical protein
MNVASPTDRARERPAIVTDPSDKQARVTQLRAAIANVPPGELKTALSGYSAVPPAASVAARNALNALRRHRDPASVFDRPQYRPALPYVAASVADECLTQTVEVLGEHSETPTREQLLEALEEVRTSFSDTTVAVMLASVAYDDLPSSALCTELLAEDRRFGLTGLDVAEDSGAEESSVDESVVEESSVDESVAVAGATAAGIGGSGTETRAADREVPGVPGVSPEQRAARRAKKEKVRAERRRKAEVAQRADDQVRQRRKQERARPGSPG